MIKGMIFDLDGTTLNTLEDLHASFNLMMKEFGYGNFSLDEVRMGVGHGLKALINNLGPRDLDQETKDKMAKCFREKYSGNYMIRTKPYPGIKKMLEELQAKGIKLAAHSNKDDIYVKNLMAENFPQISFIECRGAIEGIALKPDPEAVYLILEKMGLNKEEVVYVGDSDTDIETAKNAGLRSIGCLWGFRDYETLKTAGADYIVKGPEEIIDLVKEEKQ